LLQWLFAGENSISFKRVEAMTRSQTQIDMKAMQSPQANIPMDNRRDISLPANTKDRYV